MPSSTRAISSTSKLEKPVGTISTHGYTEIRSIGRGSFGEAVLVRDRDGQCFVMKTVDIGNLDSEQQKDAVNEVRVLSSLKHPYIVRYHESFITDGTLAIVMDYAEGGDLAKRIKEKSGRLRQSFEEALIIRWLTQAALGLKYLHKRNIIHRDIKPQNMFLTSKDDLRIGDFGISKKLGNKAHVVDQTIGTPYYLSPEICTERLYSFASDMWALGCVLYELSALHVPFEAQHITSLIKKITSGVIPVVPKTYTVAFRQLVNSLLSQDHKRRASANDVVQGPMVQCEMRKMLGGIPGGTPDPSPPESALPSHRSQSPRPSTALQPQSQQSESPRHLRASGARPQTAVPMQPPSGVPRSMRPTSAMPMHPPDAVPRAMRPTSAAPSRPPAQQVEPISPWPATPARQQSSERAQSPRSMLRHSGANVMSTPNQMPKAQESNLKEGRPKSALFRACQEAVSNRKDAGREDLCSRRPSFPRPPSPSPFMARNGRPQSAVPYGQQRRSYAFGGC